MDDVERADGLPDPSMPNTETQGRQEPPGWALERARNDLFDVDDDTAILFRAWEIVRQTQQLDEERHDEYDDPDLGGEA